MGEPRQNFAMDAIQEFKVSTSNYKAEYGLATGGLLTVVTKSGTNQLHGSGLLFFRDASITAKEFFQTTKPDYRRYQYGGTIGGPIVKDKTHFFFAYEGTKEKQFFTVNARGLWPQYEGTFQSEQTAGPTTSKLDHQLVAGPEPVLPLRRRGRVPADHHGRRPRRRRRNSFDFAVPRKSAVLGHTWVMSIACAERLPLPVRVREVRSVAALQPRRLGAGRLRGAAAAAARRSSAIRRSRSAAAATRRWAPRSRWQVKDDFSYLMHALGRHAPVEDRRSTSATSRSKATTRTRRSAAGRSRGTRPTTRTTRRPIRRSTRTRCRPTRTSRSRPSPATCRTTGRWRSGLTFNLGLRYDLQNGSFNEDVPELLASIQEKLGRDGSFPLDVSVVQQPTAEPRRLQQLRTARRRGVGSGEQRRAPTSTPRTGMFYDNMRTLQNFGELTWPQAKPIIITRPDVPRSARRPVARVVPQHRAAEHHRRQSNDR